mmetsp:Transcript_50096/g.123062  ORF Transcript_50096/g.123062 Transcript_50096/m.123062 type:complete len:210 (+) Transcript_50096:214-843(+)
MPRGKFSRWPARARATSASSRLPVSSVLCRSSSVMPSITHSGSITLPFDLLILRLCASRTMACSITSRNGRRSVRCSDIITMRATQKKRMSWPVSSSCVGKKRSRSAVRSGQPNTLNGKRPLLNHVSSTSASCATRTRASGTPCLAAARRTASRSSYAATHDAVTFGSSSRHGASSPSPSPSRTLTRYAGMRWPHHSCREMHHGRGLSR